MPASCGKGSGNVQRPDRQGAVPKLLVVQAPSKHRLVTRSQNATRFGSEHAKVVTGVPVGSVGQGRPRFCTASAQMGLQTVTAQVGNMAFDCVNRGIVNVLPECAGMFVR